MRATCPWRRLQRANDSHSYTIAEAAVAAGRSTAVCVWLRKYLRCQHTLCTATLFGDLR